MPRRRVTSCQSWRSPASTTIPRPRLPRGRPVRDAKRGPSRSRFDRPQLPATVRDHGHPRSRGCSSTARAYERVMVPDPASDHGERHVCRADRRIHRLCAQWMGWRGGRGDCRLGCRGPDRSPHAAHRAWDIARASHAQGSAIPSAIRSARGQLAAPVPRSRREWQRATRPAGTKPASKFRRLPIPYSLRSTSRELPSPVLDEGTHGALTAGSKRPGRSSTRGKVESHVRSSSSGGKSGSKPARRSEGGRRERAVKAAPRPRGVLHPRRRPRRDTAPIWTSYRRNPSQEFADAPVRPIPRDRGPWLPDARCVRWISCRKRRAERIHCVVSRGQRNADASAVC